MGGGGRAVKALVVCPTREAYEYPSGRTDATASQSAARNAVGHSERQVAEWLPMKDGACANGILPAPLGYGTLDGVVVFMCTYHWNPCLPIWGVQTGFIGRVKKIKNDS